MLPHHDGQNLNKRGNAPLFANPGCFPFRIHVMPVAFATSTLWYRYRYRYMVWIVLTLTVNLTDNSQTIVNIVRTYVTLLSELMEFEKVPVQ